MSSSYNCVIVLGPTAVGKTSIGVQLAHKFNGEIISADSRQTYRHLDIGSGKDLAEYTVDGTPIPYHLIDIIDLPDEYTVYNYQQDFYRAFKDIQSRGKLPVVVGGTGMYFNWIIRIIPKPMGPQPYTKTLLPLLMPKCSTELWHSKRESNTPPLI